MARDSKEDPGPKIVRKQVENHETVSGRTTSHRGGLKPKRFSEGERKPDKEHSSRLCGK